eukprot:1091135-Rhodomonas_salina.2
MRVFFCVCLCVFLPVSVYFCLDSCLAPVDFRLVPADSLASVDAGWLSSLAPVDFRLAPVDAVALRRLTM